MNRFKLLLLALLPTLVFAQPKNLKHVIVIGVDGLAARQMHRAKTPVLNQMMQTGAYSLKARCIRPSSSASNWASMMMGAGPELAGYTKWDSKTPEIPPRVVDAFGMFPSIYGELRQQKPKATIGVIYSWDGIGYLFPKAAVNKDEHPKGDSMVTVNSVKYIKEVKPEFLFIHIGDVDGAGHNIGWETEAYARAIEKLDEQIGIIWEGVKQAGIMNETVILVTSDHGGLKTGHGGDSLEELEIPWIMVGAGVAKGKEIKESIVTYDTAATIAWLFGLKRPQVWTGRPVTTAFK